MIYDELEEKLKYSPTLKFLRSRKAALMICFFHEHFKSKNEIALPNDYLVKELAELIEQLQFVDEEEELLPETFSTDPIAKAKRYIEHWTQENYLRNYLDEHAKKIYSVLTKHTERAFQMLELLRDREFVGTESKFRDIFHKLQEVVGNSIADPQTRIEELERRKEALQAEIDKIKSEGVVKQFEDYQIKSRIDDVYRLTNELAGDFKEVEENFRSITKALYEKQAQQIYSKGNLLGYAFDAVDKLKESDQGKSFYTFWHFLLNDTQQNNLRRLIEQSVEVMQERNLPFNEKFLRRIKTMLHSAGQKVLESNDQLGEKLSKVIAEKNSDERKRSQQTIREIRLLALKLTECELPDECGITLEFSAEIHLPIERKLCEEQTTGVYHASPTLASPVADLKTLKKLFNPNLIDRKVLAQNIKTLLQEQPQITLQAVIEAYPLQKGLSELIAYITLSENTQKVLVDEKTIVPLLFDVANGKYLDAPKITYLR